MAAEGFGIIDLESVEAGETLHFDELGLAAALAVFANAEIEGQEMGVGVFVGDAVGRRDGAFGPFFESRVGMRSTMCSQASMSRAAKPAGMKTGVSAIRNSMAPGIAAVEVVQEIVRIVAG